MENILGISKENQKLLVKIRRELHMNAETSQNEVKTSKIIMKYLDEFGISYKSGVGGNGIVAEIIGGNPGKIVALRADMDALEMREETNIDFKSIDENVMHSCGHDSHMTFLLGAAKLLNENKDKIRGKVKLVFQPAEELSPIGGAPKILESGLLDDVDAIFGSHVWPDLPFGKIAVKEGAMMANSDHFTIKFIGASSHAAKPHEGVDAVIMGAQFVNAMQTLISRNTDPMNSAVLTVGRFIAGTRYNVMAEEAIIDGTCRTFSKEDRMRIFRDMENLAKAIAQVNHGDCEYNYGFGYPAVINEKNSVKIVKESATELFGEDAILNIEKPAMTAEDFAFYLQKIKGAFYWVGIGSKMEKNYPLHSKNFYLNEEILYRGAALMYEIAINFLSKN
ncbi:MULTISPECIES: M20 family metallopeptidase [Peptoniphilus]|uniref:M20 metallopeptidase family protein n=1 Tax=Peptoniphilus TaxID=162289 RepID=UPI000287A709|nr:MULTISPECIES: M20 family metallopeptidase [Peptoniphilus]MDU1044088.1 M20 family metallopeptidase [Peptoniphilus rhinitidis]MDU1955036.1 M20 family metallopeptidase [Peptoniphilus lacydonensis]MDU2109860.1 M20 family metallopeptidase [Peptoniphilus lacydonensis]MDU2115955.1 M20 family metallopeptidase [Peptoniphilus lacydonensis]MDU3751240.1 M20 family metallopeptidase [Peptoniphilus rhinitidis]